MTGNCLRGSRGIVVFDGAWDQGEKEGEGAEEWKGLMKEMLTHVSTIKLFRQGHALARQREHRCRRESDPY